MQHVNVVSGADLSGGVQRGGRHVNVVTASDLGRTSDVRRGRHVNVATASDLGRTRTLSASGKDLSFRADRRAASRAAAREAAASRRGLVGVTAPVRTAGITTVSRVRPGVTNVTARQVNPQLASRWRSDWGRWGRRFGYRGQFSEPFFRTHFWASPWFLFPFSYWSRSYDPCWSWSVWGGRRYRYYCYYDDYPDIRDLMLAGEIRKARRLIDEQRREIEYISDRLEREREQRRIDFLQAGLDKVQEDEGPVDEGQE